MAAQYKTNNEFMKQLTIQQIVDLYEVISGILFWIKDADGKIVHCNRTFVNQLGKAKAEDVIGLNDYDLYPHHVAKQFIVDDSKVLSGEEVTNRLELNFMRNGAMAWFTTSKRPLLNTDGTIIGTYGISRHLEASNQEPLGMESLQKPVDYIRENYADEIKIKDLANHCHLSVSALERRFKKYLSKSPLQFLNEVRLEHARKQLIETDDPIARIANNCGFTEHSYFTKQFSRFFEVLPSEFRQKYRHIP